MSISSSKHYEDMHKFWIRKLSEPIQNTFLPKEAVIPYEKIKRKRFVMDKTTTATIMSICEQKDTQMFVVLVSAIKLVWYKFFGQEDIIVGSLPYMSDGAEQSLNTVIPLREVLQKGLTFSEFVAQVRLSVMEVFINQHISLERVYSQLGIESNFMSILVAMDSFQKNGLEKRSPLPDNIPVQIRVNRGSGELSFELEYDSTIEERGILQLFSYVQEILCNPALYFDRKIKDIQLLRHDDYQFYKDHFNDTYNSHPDSLTVHERFEQQVRQTPDLVALSCDGRSITYLQLNERANQLARNLRDKGVNPDTIVGILAGNSLETVTAILGVLKAGGAYLPLDPTYPLSRLNFMIQDSGTKFLLANVNIPSGLVFEGGHFYLKDASLYTGDPSDLPCVNQQNHLVYMIYTSGSTGNPKGVLVEHRGLNNYIRWATEAYRIDKDEVFAMYSSVSFDLSVTSIFTPLLSGNQLVIYKEEFKEKVLENIICSNQATILKITPSHVSLLLSMDVHSSRIRKWIIGGENLKTETARQLQDKFGGEIFNEYGPTEATIGCMIYPFDRMRDIGVSVPIGKPINNTEIYLIDKDNVVAPPGAVAEICIAGMGLARGYLNREQTTNEKFIFHDQLGKKLYRTGDLGTINHNGDLVYLGRSDQQAKIRGYRIEMGEIETCLLQHDSVVDCTVIDLEDEAGHKVLGAFYISSVVLDEDDLSVFLKESLPEYMIPTLFMRLESIPTSVNGKIDRDHLYRLWKQRCTQFEPPRNETEELLSSLWGKVLGVEKVGINENFFRIGGDSIKAIILIGKLHQYGMTLELRDFFENPRISDLSLIVDKASTRLPTQGPVVGSVSLLPIQHWFFKDSHVEHAEYGQSIILECKDGFDEEKVAASFTALVKHHDALRLVYRIEDDQICSYTRPIEDPDLFRFHVHQLTESSINEENIGQYRKVKFDLNNGPLINLVLLKSKDNDRLVITIHHIVVDGYSWRILIDDFASLYNNLLSDEVVELMPKTDSYQMWSNELHTFIETEEFQKESEYWHQLELEKVPSLINDLNLPNGDGETKTVSFRITEDDTNNLVYLANRARDTEINDLLLSALALAVQDCTGQQKTAVMLEGHGRESIGKQLNLSRTVGWFTTMFPVILEVDPMDDLGATLVRNKQMLNAIPRKGIGYGLLKYIYSQSEGCFVQNIYPQISFNYLENAEAGLENMPFQISYFDDSDSVMTTGDCPLHIVGIIKNRCLHMYLHADERVFHESLLSSLMDHYQTRLLGMIKYCTMSDLLGPEGEQQGAEEVSAEEMKDIEKMLEQLSLNDEE